MEAITAVLIVSLVFTVCFIVFGSGALFIHKSKYAEQAHKSFRRTAIWILVTLASVYLGLSVWSFFSLWLLVSSR